MEQQNNEEETSPIKLKINLKTMKVMNSPSSSGSSQTAVLPTPKTVTKCPSTLRRKTPTKRGHLKEEALDLSVGKIDNERKYAVESIKNRRHLKKELQNFAKRSGWENCHNTGQPAENLAGRPKLLQAYHKHLNKGKESKPGHSKMKKYSTHVLPGSLNGSGVGLDGGNDPKPGPSNMKKYSTQHVLPGSLNGSGVGLDGGNDPKPGPSNMKKYSTQHVLPGNLNGSGVGLDREDYLRFGPSAQNTVGSNAPDSPRRLNESSIGINESLDVSKEEDRNITSVQYDRMEDALYISFDRVRTDVPKGKQPLRVIHGTVVDDEMVYVVEHQSINAKPENNNNNNEPNILEAKNIDVYDANFFKSKYPAMVIDFIESRIKPNTREGKTKADEDGAMNLVRYNSIANIPERLSDFNRRDERVPHQSLGMEQQPQMSGPFGVAGYNHQQQQQQQQQQQHNAQNQQPPSQSMSSMYNSYQSQGGQGILGSIEEVNMVGGGVGSMMRCEAGPSHQEQPMNSDGGPTANFVNSRNRYEDPACDLFEYLANDEFGHMAGFIEDFLPLLDPTPIQLDSD